MIDAQAKLAAELDVAGVQLGALGPAPAGTFVFCEHVRDTGARGRIQDLLTPLWQRIAAGCHLNRRTQAAIKEAGLAVREVAVFAPWPNFPVNVPMIRGRSRPLDRRARRPRCGVGHWPSDRDRRRDGDRMTRRVLIIGAGLTGLALANGLRRAGDIEVTVVEQAPVITEAGWAISLTDRHLEALR
ncbi:FAD-dependent monooxygenase [Streptosporangium sp. NPDC002544]|uniref:FAD-dependent oxidoreductase n=1 Tax=Streptosporangium sp. NPDC002544 TaxID=3154538 RepID=UPI00332E13FF